MKRAEKGQGRQGRFVFASMFIYWWEHAEEEGEKTQVPTAEAWKLWEGWGLGRPWTGGNEVEGREEGLTGVV